MRHNEFVQIRLSAEAFGARLCVGFGLGLWLNAARPLGYHTFQARATGLRVLPRPGWRARSLGRLKVNSEDGESYFLAVGGGGACGGLPFCSSRHNPQGNGLPCLGHFVALMLYTSESGQTAAPASNLFGFCRIISAAAAALILRELVTLCQTKIRLAWVPPANRPGSLARRSRLALFQFRCSAIPLNDVVTFASRVFQLRAV